MTDTKNRQRTKYRTTNWKTYNAALTARGSLTMWLDPGMQWLATPSGKRGRSPTFSDASKLDWPVPDFSTVCRCQKTLQVERATSEPKSALQLLVDSTGIKFLGEVAGTDCGTASYS